MALANRAPVTARRIASGRSGHLRIGFTAASGFSILGPLLEEIGAIVPDVDIDLQELVTGEQIQGLLTGELDLGLARPPFDTEVFDSHLLYRESMVLAVPAAIPSRTSTGTSRTRTSRTSRSSCTPPRRRRYFYDLVVRMHAVQHENVVHTVSQILTMVSLVAAKRGVAFVPHSATPWASSGVAFLPTGQRERRASGAACHLEPGRSGTRRLARLLRDLEFRGQLSSLPPSSGQCAKGINGYKNALRQA